MKIKLGRPVEYANQAKANSMSIGDANLTDDNRRSKQVYDKGSANLVDDKAASVNPTNRVDRIEPTQKSESSKTEYTNLAKQRTDKVTQLRKQFISQSVTESSAKSDVKREQNKKEIVEKLSSSSDDSKRIREEFNVSKEKLSTKIIEQNDNTAQAQAKLRESKRQLLSQIQQTTDHNNKIKLDLNQNKRELTSKNFEEVTVAETKVQTVIEDNSKKVEQSSISERKAELFKKVLDNTSEDASIKLKLSQYKRELAQANAQREKIANETLEVDASLKEILNEDLKVNSNDISNELDKVAELIKQQENAKKLNELVSSAFDDSNINSGENVENNNFKQTSIKSRNKSVKLKLPLDDTRANSKVYSNKSKSSAKANYSNDIDVSSKKSSSKSNIIEFNSNKSSVSDTYKSPNLTSFDIYSNNYDYAVSSVAYTKSDITDISMVVSNNSSSESSSTNSSIDAKKLAIINEISVGIDESGDIKQKLREYQAEVRRINSEILSLTEQSKNNPISYTNSQEESSIDYDDGFVLIPDVISEEDLQAKQFHDVMELAEDMEEAEVLINAQEQMQSFIKILATEIKQDELLAKISEQEQVIARNKILDKRESLIELAKQNNELLRTLNERLSIISKKAVRSVIYSPTIISQKNKMTA